MAGSTVSVCSTKYSRKRGDPFQRAYIFGTRFAMKHAVLMAVVIIVLPYSPATVFMLTDDLQGLGNEIAILVIMFVIMVPALSEVFVESAYLQSLEYSEIGFFNSFGRNVIIVAGHVAVALVFDSTISIWVICCVMEMTGGFMMWLLTKRFVTRFVKVNPCPAGEVQAS